MKRLTLAGLAAVLLLCGIHPARAQVSGQRVYTYNSSVHITSNTTTTVAPTPHILVSVCINTKGASANTITVKDGTTTLAVIDSTVNWGCVDHNVALSTGLSIVTATGTAPDLTVVYR